MTTKYRDALGAPLMLGDTVYYTDETGKRYRGVIEHPLDYGRAMIRLTQRYDATRGAWIDCSVPVTQFRLLEGCGKRRFSRCLDRVELIARARTGRRAG